MSNPSRIAASIFLAPLVAGAAELPAGMAWKASVNASVPPDAVVLTPGTGELVCRARVGQAYHVGRLPPGAAACSIGLAAREVKVSAFEVLTRAGVPKAAMAMAAGQLALKPHGVLVAPAPSPAAAPKLDESDATRRGFTEDGRPYVEQTKADGTVIREYRNGLEVTSPSGAKTWYPQQRMMQSAQAGTPPELPADPMKGRRWLEMHSAALHSLISNLVGGNAADLQRLEAAEARDVRGDLFRQIEYRAEIASFFASQRKAR